MKPEQRCIILIRIDNVLNHYPPIHIFSDSRSFLRKICTSLCNNPITALFLQSSMENVRRSFTYTMILICRRTWRLWNHGLRKVLIWKLLDKVPNSSWTVQWAPICIFLDSQFRVFFQTTPSFSSSSEVASSALRGQRRNLTSTTRAGRN